MSTFTKRLLSVVLSIVLVLGLALPASAAGGTTGEPTDVIVPLPGPGGYLASESQAAIQLRNGMKARQGEIVIKLMTTRADLETLSEDIFNKALEHTGVPSEGDYLRWHLGNWGCNIVGVVEGGYNKLTMTYTMEYYTTAQQEAAVTEALETFRSQLDIEDASDYEKVVAVYDAMCEGIVYDEEGVDTDLAHSAYAALVDGKAVCQGYANLFYRAMLELGIDARLISGTCEQGAHAWNIVKLDGKYYNVDATWDATLAQADQEYQYFLKANDTFGDHTRDAEYATEAFNTAYPMGAEDYTPNAIIPGDVDGTGVVDIDDVVSLLLYVSMPNIFEVAYIPDFDNNGATDIDDVVTLLLHVSMPNIFPLSA